MLSTRIRFLPARQLISFLRTSNEAGTSTGAQKRHQEYNWRSNGNENRNFFTFRRGAALLGLSWLVTIKDILGIEPVKLDNDSLKDKIKQSWLLRKYGRYDEALQVLQIALEEAEERKEQLPITRVLDELANTYYQKGDIEEAENAFRTVIKRLIELHGTKDGDPQFIRISLKLADIFAKKGLLENAESGYKHCLKKQLQVVQQHQKNYSLAHGALVEDRHVVDTYGTTYTEPFALLGQSLESYAHFLVNYFDDARQREAEEYFDEVLKICYQIYGSTALHTVNILNTFGAILIMRNRFEAALKYLSIGIERALYINEFAPLLPGYYCNYAEALFHTGKKEEAVEYARKALALSRSEEPRMHQYCQQFLKDLERDYSKGKKKTWWLF